MLLVSLAAFLCHLTGIDSSDWNKLCNMHSLHVEQAAGIFKLNRKMCGTEPEKRLNEYGILKISCLWWQDQEIGTRRKGQENKPLFIFYKTLKNRFKWYKKCEKCHLAFLPFRVKGLTRWHFILFRKLLRACRIIHSQSAIGAENCAERKFHFKIKRRRNWNLEQLLCVLWSVSATPSSSIHTVQRMKV